MSDFQQEIAMNDVKCLIVTSIATLDRIEGSLADGTPAGKEELEALYGASSILHECYEKLDRALSLNATEDEK